MDTAAIGHLGWSDAQFFGFRWENGGKDLRLFLSHARLGPTELLCKWVSGLRVDLDWKTPGSEAACKPVPRSGPLLTWDAKFQQLESRRWRILVDFAGDGCLEFECQQVLATSHVDK